MKQSLIALVREINQCCATLNAGLAAVAFVLAIVTLFVVILSAPDYERLLPGLNLGPSSMHDEEPTCYSAVANIQLFADPGWSAP